MLDSKLAIVHLWLDIEAVLVQTTMEFCKKTLVGTLGEPALLVQQVQHSQFLNRKNQQP